MTRFALPAWRLSLKRVLGSVLQVSFSSIILGLIQYLFGIGFGLALVLALASGRSLHLIHLRPLLGDGEHEAKW